MATFWFGCVADRTLDCAVTFEDLTSFISEYEAASLKADVSDSNGSPFPDGGVDINDLLYFLQRFESGC